MAEIEDLQKQLRDQMNNFTGQGPIQIGEGSYEVVFHAPKIANVTDEERTIAVIRYNDLDEFLLAMSVLTLNKSKNLLDIKEQIKSLRGENAQRERDLYGENEEH